jgi:hypothetical protein
LCLRARRTRARTTRRVMWSSESSE